MSYEKTFYNTYFKPTLKGHDCIAEVFPPHFAFVLTKLATMSKASFNLSNRLMRHTYLLTKKSFNLRQKVHKNRRNPTLLDTLLKFHSGQEGSWHEKCLKERI